MVNKVVVSAISVILVVGAVLGVVAVVNHKNKASDDGGGGVTAQKKAVHDFCTVSSYQQTCQKSLAKANSTDPKELVTKAIEVSKEGVQKFFGFADSLIAKAQHNNSTKRGLEICKEMMELALMSLEKTLSEVGKGEMTDFEDRINDLRTWLSSVITYQGTCKDGFADDKALQEEINKNILESRQIATNALDIISKLMDILGDYGIQFALPTTTRKLLSDDGYPEWMPVSKRKLLGNLMDKNVKPNAVVAQDGSGQYKTIQEAVNAYPKGSKDPYIVYVKAGIYKEYVTVGKDQKNVIMYGDGPTKSVVTGRKSLKGPVDGGYKTIETATFAALGEGFMVRDMGFENTAGAIGEQAVAFRTSADMCAVYNCKFDGFQDTLYLHSNRNFLKNIVVSGTIDFIFGDSIGVIQDSTIVVKKPKSNQKNIIVASGKEVPKENTGIVIHNCKIVADPSLQGDKTVETYLSRPWKPYATTIFIGNTIPDFIKPEGYLPWEDVNTASETCYLAEYNNNGPGANVNQRVKWKGVVPNLDKATAMKWAPKAILHSGIGGPWLENTGIQVTYDV